MSIGFHYQTIWELHDQVSVKLQILTHVKPYGCMHIRSGVNTCICSVKQARISPFEHTRVRAYSNKAVCACTGSAVCVYVGAPGCLPPGGWGRGPNRPAARHPATMPRSLHYRAAAGRTAGNQGKGAGCGQSPCNAVLCGLWG